jgi:hypothetical protein
VAPLSPASILTPEILILAVELSSSALMWMPGRSMWACSPPWRPESASLESPSSSLSAFLTLPLASSAACRATADASDAAELAAFAPATAALASAALAASVLASAAGWTSPWSSVSIGRRAAS